MPMARSDSVPQWLRHPLGGTLAPPLDALWNYRRRGGSDVDAVKAARAAMIWRGADRSGRRRLAMLYLRWLYRAPRHFIVALVREGGAARRKYGRSLSGQVRDMARIAVANAVMPPEYCAGALARLGGDRRLFDYLPGDLVGRVVSGLTEAADPTVAAKLRDKLVFEQACRAAGLRVVRTLAVATKDAILAPDGGPFDGRLPDCDVVLKPSSGLLGRRIELWCRRGHGYVSGGAGETVGADRLLARARALAAEGDIPILVQERLFNNPRLAPLAGDALATTRIVTARNEENAPEIVDAFYRSSVVAGAAVDNFHAGGVIFPIDIATGAFRPGMRDAAYDPAGISDHPATGTVMVGRAHPGWEEMAGLALRLHRLFPGLMMPGWDVGWDGEGAVAVEGSSTSGLSINRQGTVGGAARMRGFALVAHHARLWLAENEPEGSRWRPAGLTDAGR